MSNYTTNATTVLQINGQQAQQTLAQLRQNALNLETAIARAASAGNKTDLRRLRKDLNSTRREIRDMESSTQRVENILRRLDKATPKELQKSLQTLNHQLEYMERGSEAWKRQVVRIKAVRDELSRLNAEMRTQESGWERFNRKLNDWQTSIMGMMAAITGLVMAGRSAVNKYAEMEEELANTRKYTGMSEENVLRLNEAFKKMDTRTSREQLNELAQEAGRLGKNTLESVQGYVEAANIINVALVDLGNGATQTIAKLTNMFGVEELLGTRDAMLAVGSSVNVLSQNCTASKSYLVEFAQRMGGVGAQAKLTIPQLLAFGATLDANGQKVEMSASALGKLTMMLFQKPGEVAQQVGLDVEKFNEALRRSTNEGLIMFLERIKELGSKDGLTALAPLFKDLGMDGVRMSQVVSTLAEHLDMVKWEQQEANKAFREATSASNEYKIFNNTVQAGIDKARKRISELAVELGEKLLPIMKHVYTSTSITLRVLSIIVDFVIKYSSAIITAVASFVAYKIAVNAANIAMNAHYAVLVLTQGAMAMVQKGSILLQMAFFALTGQTTKAKNAFLAFNMLTKSSPWGILIAGITAVIGGLVAFIKNIRDTRAEQTRARKEQEEWRKSLTDVDTASDRYCANEITRLKSLYNEATNEAKSKDERRKAAERLQKLYPDYFANLSTEEIMVGKAKSKYDDLTASIIASARARAAAEKIKANESELLSLEDELDKAKSNAETARKNEESANNQVSRDRERSILTSSVFATNSAEASGINYTMTKESNENLQAAIKEREKAESLVSELTQKQADLNAANKRLAEKYNISTADLEKGSGANGPNGANDEDTNNYHNGETASSSSKSEDKFKSEKQWKEREEALNRISYATGQKNYEDYTSRMNEISIEFYRRELEHTDLNENERLTIQAQYQEALKKQTDAALSQTITAEKNSYAEKLATEKQRYIDGLISIEQFNDASELLELDHLRKMTFITKEGSRERAEAESAYQEKLFNDQRNRREKAEKEEKKHQEDLQKIKQKVFGNNPAENKAAYDSALSNLLQVYSAELDAAGDNAAEKLRIEEAFQKAKLELIKQYGQEGAAENKNFLAQWGEGVQKWMESDMGKAVTQSADTLISGMSSIFSGLSSLIQAELEIQTASINKRYDNEISRAEGNSYKVSQLEKQKEKEIAKAKNEANRKMFAMQVIQAVAQTAQNALAAYGSAASIPVVGYILAPIAAAMAVAAGAIQIASIKKQQQASETQGYASGGFTPKGRVDEEVGVVHAGEWVASQRLLANPQAKAIVNMLDYAQRTNTIGSIKSADVSRSITAPMEIASMQTPLVGAVNAISKQTSFDEPFVNKSDEDKISDVLNKLNARLDEPFVTVNTVTGDTGIKHAQEEYERLMKNKSPKSRR